ncbi:LysR substrate-binding domain-containing protein, partial [Burkholderia semiarida]
PAYLREHGLPEQPQDLLHGHWSVGYASPRTGRELPWEWRGASDVDGVGGVDGVEGPQTLAVSSRVVTNNAESYIACCRAGLGLIQIPRYDVQHLLDTGELVEVLPAHRAAPMPVALLYPHRFLTLIETYAL